MLFEAVDCTQIAIKTSSSDESARFKRCKHSRQGVAHITHVGFQQIKIGHIQGE